MLKKVFVSSNNVSNNINDVIDNTNYIYREGKRIDLAGPDRVEGVVSLNTISLKNPIDPPISKIGFGRVLINLETHQITGLESVGLETTREDYINNPVPAIKEAYEDVITDYKTVLENATIVVTPGTLEVRIHYIMPFL